MTGLPVAAWGVVWGWLALLLPLGALVSEPCACGRGLVVEGLHPRVVREVALEVRREEEGPRVGELEDLVADMLKPMLKDWLEQNLPPMVERMVKEEIERVARRGR